MKTKQELTKQVYLLLSVIHLNGFQMSPEMAKRVSSRWPPVMGDRPASAEAVVKLYDKILNQPMDDTPSKTPKSSKSVKAAVKLNTASPFSLARPKKNAQSTRKTSPEMVVTEGDSEDNDLPRSQSIRKRIHDLDFSSQLSDHLDNDYELEQADYDEGMADQTSQSPEETPSKKQRRV